MLSFKALPFLVVFIIAIFLRGQEVFTNNYLFLLDQGRDMLKVKEIVFEHHLTLIGPYTSLGGVFQGPFYYYLISIPAFLMQGDPLGPLILMLLISLLTIIIASMFMYRLFGYVTALVTMITFAVSPEAVAAATYTWNPHPMWFLVTLYTFLLFQWTCGKEKYLIFLLPTLGFMFHFQTALGVFLSFATVLYVLIQKRRKAFNTYLFLGLFLSFFTFTPQIVFEIRHDFLMSKSVISLLSGNNRGLFIGWESKNYFHLLDNHKTELIQNYRSSFMRDGVLTGLPLLVFVYCFFFVLFGRKVGLLTIKEYSFVTTIVKIVVFFVIATSFYPFPIRYWFLTGFQSLYLLVAGLLFSKLMRFAIGKIILFALFLVILYYTVLRLDVLYFHPTDDGGTAKIKGKKAAIDYIYHDAHGQPFGLLVFTPPVNTDAYDYLIWWYGKSKYGYVPHKEKRGTFYLLIEVDRHQPWTYQGWLETVIKTGEVLKTQRLSSGFIVQKRVTQ